MTEKGELDMRRFITIFKMDFGNLFKNPVLVGYNTAFAGLLILILGYFCGGDYADSNTAYQYYTISLIIYPYRRLMSASPFKSHFHFKLN